MADAPAVLSFNQGIINKQRYAELNKCFKEIYGKGPQFYARAPGRVNLIGEHIDYCGYAVLPMALEQDIVIAVARNASNKINLQNVDNQYLPFSTDVHSIDIDQKAPKWFHYFLCGFKGITENLPSNKMYGFDVMLSGTVPRSAGLSSSSALVCAAGLATMHLNDMSLSKLELADICTKCERYIGTIGGGMDQSISFLAESGTAKFIEFSPLRATDVNLPDRIVFVISNSCVELNKAATSHFNTRVVECRLAAQIIAKSRNLPWKELKKLRDVQKSLGLSLQDMLGVVDEVLHKQPFSKNEICLILDVTAEELNKLSLSQNTLDVTSFKLHNRAYHVYSEANRVLEFRKCCDEQPADAIKRLGRLMNDSHSSCKDMYECSCSELDQLVQICQDSGAVGSRLTGAGWGGCAVSLVLKKNLDYFMQNVRSNYYSNHTSRKNKIEQSLFATQPGSGAAIYLS